MTTSKHIAIVGAGMAAITCARTLVQAGHRVTVIEKSHTVGGRMAYGKSLLYLVSRACEHKRDTPILGLHTCIENDAELVEAYRVTSAADLPSLILSGGKVEAAGRETASSQSHSHGGFDNDAPTLNSVLYRILGHLPSRPFTSRDLTYD